MHPSMHTGSGDMSCTTNGKKWKGFFTPMSVEVTHKFRTSNSGCDSSASSGPSYHVIPRPMKNSHPAEILTEAHLLLRRSLGYDLKEEINRIRNELQKIQDFYGIYHSLNKLSQCYRKKNSKASIFSF